VRRLVCWRGRVRFENEVAQVREVENEEARRGGRGGAERGKDGWMDGGGGEEEKKGGRKRDRKSQI